MGKFRCNAHFGRFIRIKKIYNRGIYIRIALKEMYGTEIGIGGTEGFIEKKVLCYIADEDNDSEKYTRMTEEMERQYHECFKAAREKARPKIMEAYGDYHCGLLTRTELKNEVLKIKEETYHKGKLFFYSIYFGWPMKIPVYCKYDEVPRAEVLD